MSNFILFPQCFFKTCSVHMEKQELVWERVNSLTADRITITIVQLDAKWKAWLCFWGYSTGWSISHGLLPYIRWYWIVLKLCTYIVDVLKFCKTQFGSVSYSWLRNYLPLNLEFVWNSLFLSKRQQGYYLFTTQSRLLTTERKPFENIEGKGEVAGNQHFLLSRNVFFPSKNTFQFLRNIYFVSFGKELCHI